MIKQAFALAAVAVVLLGWLPGLASAAEGKPTVILYGSRYGATEQTARWIAEGMNDQADLLAVKEAGELGAYKFIILGSGIYYDQIHADMAAFLAARKVEIKDRVVALFVVSGTGPAGGAYLETFAQALGGKPDLVKAFGGYIKKERLSPEDTKALEEYYKSVNQPFENFDNTNKEACLEFGSEILKAIK